MHLTFSTKNQRPAFESVGESQETATWAAGYGYQGDTPQVEGELAGWIESLLKSDDPKHDFRSANGSFCGVRIVSDDEIECVMGRFGAFPLYYSLDYTGLEISDDYWALVDGKPSATLNRQSAMQMLAAGYAFGNETMVEGIHEFPAASIIRFRRDPDSQKITMDTPERYWEYQWATGPAPSVDEVVESFLGMGRRTANLLNLTNPDGRISLSLTGGGDSRLLAFLLCKEGYEPTFYTSRTIGVEPTAQEIAHRLQCEHVLLPSWLKNQVDPPSDLFWSLSPTTIFGVANHVCDMHAYAGDSAPPISGHLGDVAAGSHLSPHLLYAGRMGISACLRHIKHYHWNTALMIQPILRENAGNEMAQAFHSVQASFESMKEDDLTCRTVQFDLSNRQRRFILREEVARRSLFGLAPMPYQDAEYWDVMMRASSPWLLDRSLFFNACKELYRSSPSRLDQVPLNGKLLRKVKYPRCAASRNFGAFLFDRLCVRKIRGKFQRKKSVPVVTDRSPMDHGSDRWVEALSPLCDPSDLQKFIQASIASSGFVCHPLRALYTIANINMRLQGESPIVPL